MTADADPVPSLRDWAFSVYDLPGVEDACLELQDRHGMDVVALLWCIWAGRHHGVIDAGAMERIVAETAPWHAEVVAPLRAVRRRLKQADGSSAPNRHDIERAAIDSAGSGGDGADRSGLDRLRQQVADTELAAEVIQLERLDAATATTAKSGSTSIVRRTGPAAVAANVANLVELAGRGDDRTRDRTIRSLVRRLAGSGG